MSSFGGLKNRVKGQVGPPLRFLIAMLAVMWGLEIVDAFTPYNFDKWGIVPRSVRGLAGIPFCPWLHGGFSHLIANTIPLFVLGLVIGLRGLRNLVDVTTIVVLLGGAGVWLFATNGTATQVKVHIGASGLVFGYFGYLIARGFFDKSVKSLLVGVVILLLYGSLFLGVLPTQPGVSWESHLFGLLAGGVAAKLTAKRVSSFSIE